MADNVSIDPGTTPSVPVAADEIAGVKYQRVKLAIGDDGTAVDVGASQSVPVSDSGGSLTVDFASQPLPTGAATAAKQPALGTAGSASADVISVQGIASGTPLPIAGSISVTGTMPVDSSHAEDAAHASSDVGAFMLSVRKDTATQLAGTDGDYAPIITDASGRTHVNVGTSALPTGAATETSVALSATALGAPADAAATTTGSVIAQLRRIANLVAGTLTVSGSVNTTPLLPVQATTGTLANVAGSASSVTLQASNASRKGLVIVNDSTAILYVKLNSAAASATSYTYFMAGSVSGVPSTLELPGITYTGAVTGIWASATGNARVTELT